MIHERPGVWSAFGAQGTTELTDRRLAAVIAPADAAEGVQLVHSAAEAVSLYGGNALLTRMLKLCLANCGDPVYAVAVDEDTKVAYETALTALFAAAKPGVLIVGSAREDVQLLLRETAEANECLGVAGMKGASADALVARAKALCCARIVLTGPDVLAQDEAVADGFCAICGRRWRRGSARRRTARSRARPSAAPCCSCCRTIARGAGSARSAICASMQMPAMRRCAAWSSPIPSRRGCTASPFRHR